MSIISYDHQYGTVRETPSLPRDAAEQARALVEKLDGSWRGSSGQCRCPAHDDVNPSLPSG